MNVILLSIVWSMMMYNIVIQTRASYNSMASHTHHSHTRWQTYKTTDKEKLVTTVLCWLLKPEFTTWLLANCWRLIDEFKCEIYSRLHNQPTEKLLQINWQSLKQRLYINLFTFTSLSAHQDLQILFSYFSALTKFSHVSST